MRTTCKVHADFGALLAAVHLDNAAFKALEGALNHKNAVVFVKAHQGRANFRSQPHKVPDNLQVLARQRRNLRVALFIHLGGPPAAAPRGSAVPGLTNVRRPRSFVRKAHSFTVVAGFATLT